MNVRFISKTTSPQYGDDAEALMIYCARVSSDNQDNPDYERLLRYCIKNGHWSVFEQADMCVEIETSIAVSMQILRHRSFVFQQLSRRYSSSNVSFEPLELRLQGDSKQGSGDRYKTTDHDRWMIRNAVNISDELYHKLVSQGVSRETARMFLPMCTTTKLFMKGSVRSWIHYLQVRLHEHTQKEHRIVAESILEIFKEHFPVTAQAMGWK